jgi:DNA replication and repair protein RecF
MRSLSVASLSIRGFRNLAKVDVDLGPRFNVLSGDNGQGKTNLLEAVYVLATSRSFRTTKLSELVIAGGEVATIRGRIVEAGAPREQSVGVKPGLRAVRIDGKRPPTLAEYALQTPTVVFHPGAVALSAGSGSERRRLLDRIGLYLSAGSLTEIVSHGKAMRARQRVLESRGDAAVDLDGWEELMATHGAAVHAARRAAADVLVPAAREAFSRIGQPDLQVSGSYQPGGPEDVARHLAELRRRRVQDRARGSATVGPHRDDLVLELGGRPVRGMASQGQHRAVVLALQLAEIHVVARARQVRPLLLLDDVSSELDRSRTAALLGALRAEQGQVLVTTTRAELIETSSSDRVDLRAVGGQIAIG